MRRATGRIRLTGLLALGALELVGLALLGWWPSGRGTPWPALAIWSGAFAVYVAAAWWTLRRSRTDRVHASAAEAGPDAEAAAGGAAGAGGTGEARRLLLAIWIVGLALRALVFPLEPHFSDDIYRYLWDGWVSLHGVNPYLHAPDAAALESLRTSWHALVNHPSVPTIYPPAAQVLFHGVVQITPVVGVFKLVFVLADLGIAAVIQRTARAAGRSPIVPVLLWLWSPLVVVEVAWSGHLDPVGILPMAGGLALLGAASLARGTGSGAEIRERSPTRPRGPARLAGGALLGLGAAVKFAPLAAAPVLARRRRWRALAALLLVPLLLYLPYAEAGAALFGGLGEYARRWAFNGGIHRLLDALLGGALALRPLLGGLLAALVSLAVLRRWSAAFTLYAALGAGLLLSPTLHPWYVLWILPFACLRGSPPWILLSGTVFLGYAGLHAFRATGTWPEPAGLALAVHGPVLALLARDGFRRLREGASEPEDRRRPVAGAEQEREEGPGQVTRAGEAPSGDHEKDGQEAPD